LLERRVGEVAHGIAAAYGATARVEYSRDCPITANHARETEFAVKIASEVAGATKVAADTPPIMAGEDFAFMLEARPGNMIFIGNGDTAALLKWRQWVVLRRPVSCPIEKKPLHSSSLACAATVLPSPRREHLGMCSEAGSTALIPAFSVHSGDAAEI